MLAEGVGGTVFAAWEDADADGGPIVRAAVRNAAGGWGTAGTASAVGAGDPQLAVDAGGTAFLVWSRLQDEGDDGVNLIESRALAPDGRLSGVQEVARSANQELSDPLVGADDAGAVTVAWTREVGSGARLEARRRAASGAFEPTAVTVAVVADDPADDLAVTAAGDVVVAYLGDEDAERVFAAVRRGAGSFAA